MTTRSVQAVTRRTMLEGKRIMKVTLERGVSENTGKAYSHVRQVEFDDGTLLVLSVVETGADYAITANLWSEE